jgi:hypothetical protein
LEDLGKNVAAPVQSMASTIGVGLTQGMRGAAALLKQAAAATKQAAVSAGVASSKPPQILDDEPDQGGAPTPK